MVGISGGKFFNQYRVFFVYRSPNQDGHAKQDGWGNLAIAIGSGFSTATYGALALRHSKKKVRARFISLNRNEFTQASCSADQNQSQPGHSSSRDTIWIDDTLQR